MARGPCCVTEGIKKRRSFSPRHGYGSEETPSRPVYEIVIAGCICVPPRPGSQLSQCCAYQGSFRKSWLREYPSQNISIQQKFYGSSALGRHNRADIAGREIGVEDLHGGGGQGRAGLALLQHQRHGDLRLVKGGEADEHAVGVVVAGLGTAGLGAGGDNTVGKLAGDTAFGHQVPHALLHGRQGGVGDLHLGEDLGLMAVEDAAAVVGIHLLEQVGIVADTAPEQSGHIVGQLEGGDLKEVADGDLEGIVSPLAWT